MIKFLINRKLKNLKEKVENTIRNLNLDNIRKVSRKIKKLIGK